MKSYTTQQFDDALQAGPYAWPGGYPIYFIASDGAALSYAAALENADQIRGSIADGSQDGWQVVGSDVNWEDESLYCEHSGERIPSAYGADE